MQCVQMKVNMNDIITKTKIQVSLDQCDQTVIPKCQAITYWRPHTAVALCLGRSPNFSSADNQWEELAETQHT